MSYTIKDDAVNMNNLIKGLSAIQKQSVVVGVLSDDEKLQLIASANEFGAEIHSPKAIKFMRVLAGKHKVKLTPHNKGFIKIPERSFIRSTADDVEVQNKIVETTAFYLERALTAQNTFKEVLTRPAQLLKKLIQARIASDLTPKNHPLTIEIKGNDKTLRGKSKTLIKSIDYEIEE